MYTSVVLFMGGSKRCRVLYCPYSTNQALNWANIAHLGKYSTIMRRIYLRNVTETTHCKLLKSAKLILQVRSTARNRLYKHILIV